MAPRRNLIAIVDDDPGIREALRRLLPEFGYHIELFESGAEFISAAAGLEPACLIVDLELGGISGIELVRRLLANGMTTPVIWMTGCTDELLQKQAIDLSAAAYLHKPLSLDALIRAIEKATARNPKGNGARREQ